MQDKEAKQGLESALNTFLYNYLYEVVNPRLEDFSKSYYKSPWSMFKRHFKNDLLDLFTSLNNLASWIYKSITKKEGFAKTSRSEKEILHKFTHDVFCVELLQDKLQVFLDNYFLQEMKDNAQRQNELKECSQNWKDEIAKKALQITSLKRLSTKASSFLIDLGITTGIVGEASRGFGAIAGSFIANKIYMSQQNIFYYYWYTFTGRPEWVELTGAIAGAIIGIVVFVPLVGMLVEYIMQPFNDTAKQVRKAYPELIYRLINGDDKDKKTGLMEVSIKYLDGCTNVLDTLRSAARAL
ncbi:hypothetical protein JHD50_09575 [Sulfurimonas sp. MAG313]|nr:hypothetical protein [Sulfurimonas sp. MAG313]MDF1881547.1 hypothetical protein [Sulfurimonas sp. MAG313]